MIRLIGVIILSTWICGCAEKAAVTRPVGAVPPTTKSAPTVVSSAPVAAQSNQGVVFSGATGAPIAAEAAPVAAPIAAKPTTSKRVSKKSAPPNVYSASEQLEGHAKSAKAVYGDTGQKAEADANRARAEAKAKASREEGIVIWKKSARGEAMARAPAAEGVVAKLFVEVPIPSFPWPPPVASATAIVPQYLLLPKTLATSTPMLKDVDATLSKALDLAGYTDKSYYAVPQGFAMVTRLERIDADGTPMQEPTRWSMEKKPLSKFSFSTYLKALFTAEPGYYRVIVFVVTPVPFAQKDAVVTDADARVWLEGGLNKLPESIGSAAYTDGFTCTALVYEFEQPATQKSGKIMMPGLLSGKTHLIKARIWSANVWEH